jgi:hypothetical protein
MKRTLLISALMLGCTAACAQAQSQPMQPASAPAPLASQPGGPPFGWHRPHRIPPEIEAACQGKSVGTKVDVTFRDGDTRSIECGVFRHPHFHRPPGAPASGVPGGPGPGNPPPPAQ